MWLKEVFDLAADQYTKGERERDRERERDKEREREREKERGSGGPIRPVGSLIDVLIRAKVRVCVCVRL